LTGLDLSYTLRAVRTAAAGAEDAHLELAEVLAVVTPIAIEIVDEAATSTTSTTAAATTTQRTTTLQGPLSIPPVRQLEQHEMTMEEHRYAAAIERVIPAWKKIEKIAILGCPHFTVAKEAVDSLRCRVTGFVAAGGDPHFINRMGLSDANCAVPKAAKPGSGFCPGVPYSSSVVDGFQRPGVVWIVSLSALAAAGMLGSLWLAFAPQSPCGDCCRADDDVVVVSGRNERAPTWRRPRG